MRIFRKILSAVLALAILLPGVLTVSASQTCFPLSKNERLLLIDALSDIEQQKGLWGLQNVDFNKLNIGAAVHTYNYVDGIFERSHDMYPLTVDGRLVLWAIPINGQFQITSGLVSEINASIDFKTPLALVYDSSNAYIYSNQSFSNLKNFDEEVESRGAINTNARTAVRGIDTVSLAQNTSLGYKRNNQDMQRNAQTNYTCSISYVPQVYSNLCWAASVACIVNYVSGTSLDAVTVAQNYYGDTDFNRTIHEDTLTERIEDYELTQYELYIGDNCDNKILNSICAGYPVGGVFNIIWDSYHAAVIFGINPFAGRIQVMDPKFGTTTATLSSTGVYTYVSSISNTTLTLYSISFVP